MPSPRKRKPKKIEKMKYDAYKAREELGAEEFGAESDYTLKDWWQQSMDNCICGGNGCLYCEEINKDYDENIALSDLRKISKIVGTDCHCDKTYEDDVLQCYNCQTAMTLERFGAEGDKALYFYEKEAEKMYGYGYEMAIPKYIVISDQSTFDEPQWMAQITDSPTAELAGLGEGSILDIEEGWYAKSEYSSKELIEYLENKYPTLEIIGPASRLGVRAEEFESDNWGEENWCDDCDNWGEGCLCAEEFGAEYEDEWNGVEWCQHHGYEPYEVDWEHNVRIDTFKCPTCGMLRDELEILDEDLWDYAQRMGYDELKEFGVQNDGEMASPYQFHNDDMNDIIEIPFIYDERYRNEAETFEATKGMDTYAQPFSELKIKPTKTKVGILIATIVAGGFWYSKKMKE